MRSPFRKDRRKPPPPVSPPAAGTALDVEVSPAPNGALVAIAGELDLATAGRVRAAVAGEPVAAAKAAVVDLTGVTFMDSTGLASLLDFERDLTARGGRLAIACPEGPARLLLDVTGVVEHLLVRATRADAEAAVA